ncbi:MAG: PHP domain-containing protein [Succinivibrio sp.]|nr:PHP domain-containing protein [Succinivibrio sp.]
MKYCIDLHTHTIASDHAYSTIADYVHQAKECGIRMFATTDHGPSLSDAPHLWHFNNLKVVPRIIDTVAVLRGIEANITAEGGIDIPKRTRDGLDIVLAGFHPNLPPADVRTHTELLLKVIESGEVDIITHPGSVHYPFEYRTVLEAAREYGVAIEINSSSDVNTRFGSFDNCVQIARLAAELGNIISLGTDAHICYYLGNFDHSQKVLNSSGIADENILNTDPLKVLDFLESRGHKRIDLLRKFFSDRT